MSVTLRLKSVEDRDVMPYAKKKSLNLSEFNTRQVVFLGKRQAELWHICGTCVLMVQVS